MSYRPSEYDDDRYSPPARQHSQRTNSQQGPYLPSQPRYDIPQQSSSRRSHVPRNQGDHDQRYDEQHDRPNLSASRRLAPNYDSGYDRPRFPATNRLSQLEQYDRPPLSNSARRPPQPYENIPSMLSSRRQTSLPFDERAHQSSSRGPSPRPMDDSRRSDSRRSERRQIEYAGRSLRPQQSQPSMRRGSNASANYERRPPLPDALPVEYQYGIQGSVSARSRRGSVVDRMQQGGRLGVDSRVASPLSDRAARDAESPGDKRDSNDSGFSEGETNQGYFDKIKMAMWGPTDHATQPAGVFGWNLGRLAVGHGEDDDDHVDADGNTKLGRCIKQYHIARARRIEDVPDWLFTAAELAVRASTAMRAQARFELDREEQTRRYQLDREQQHQQWQYSERSPPEPRQLAEVEAPRTRRASFQAQDLDQFASGRFGTRRTSIGADGGRSRATDRLRAMTDAKRHPPI